MGESDNMVYANKDIFNDFREVSQCQEKQTAKAV
jgi:hypothetical protein